MNYPKTPGTFPYLPGIFSSPGSTNRFFSGLLSFVLFGFLVMSCADGGTCIENGTCGGDTASDFRDSVNSDSDVDPDNSEEEVDDSNQEDTDDELSEIEDPDGVDLGDDGDTNFCRPNMDGVIERSEMPIETGLHTTFRVALDVQVDTAGEDLGDGRRRWDLSEDLPGDHSVLVEAQSLAGRWFEDEFPTADYVAELSDRENLLGVFQITDEALFLLGVVSPDDGLTGTNLSYDPPVNVLVFPLTQDSSWSTEASVSGTASGVYCALCNEDYESQVDGVGELITPFGEFSVFRIRTELTRTVGFMTTTSITYIFTTECFGTIASIVSEDNEDNLEFTQAAEVKRLSP